jgi:multiple sugar transport system permease protein
MRLRWRTRILPNLLTYVVLVCITAFCIFPLAWLLLTSLKLERDIVTPVMQYVPHYVTLENYVTIWTESGFPKLIFNSALTTIYTVAICATAGALASYSLARFAFPGRRFFLLGYLVVRMFPAVLMIIPLFIAMRAIHLLDTRIGLAIAYTSFLLPLFIWMMLGFFRAAPKELEDAARIDGCTRVGALLRVVIPVVRNGLAATAVFVAISAWNEFIFALMLTTSEGSRTWPVGLQLMVGEFQLPWGPLSAGGIISILPILALFAIAQRTMVRGIAAGAVKG